MFAKVQMTGDTSLQRRSRKVDTNRLLLLKPDQSEAEEFLFLLCQRLPEIRFSNLETIVFIESWQGKTYQQIADLTDYDANYVKDVGHKLWKTLSTSLGESLSKQNFCAVLRQRLRHPLDDAFPLSPRLVDDVVEGDVVESEPVIDWGEAPTVPVFSGRSTELAQLQQWVVQEQNSLVGIFGLGGVGKTALGVKLVEQIQGQFDCVVWRSLRNQPEFEQFISDLIQRLTNTQDTCLPETPNQQVSLLIKHLQQHRCLLILDDWMSIFRSDGLAGSYLKNHESYGLLLRRLSESLHQSCVLVISREVPSGLAFKDNQVFPVRTLYLMGLRRQAGRAALRAFGLLDTDDNLDRLLECYSGNPYALRVVAQTVVDLCDGDIARFLEQNKLIYGDIRGLIDQQFSRLSEPEQLIMHGLVRRPDWVSLSDLAQDMTLAKHHGVLLEALESLLHRSFIAKQGNGWNQPTLLKEYLRSC